MRCFFHVTASLCSTRRCGASGWVLGRGNRRFSARIEPGLWAREQGPRRESYADDRSSGDEPGQAVGATGQCFHALPLADSLASQEFVHVGLGVAQERDLCPHPRDPVRVVYELVVPSDKLRLSKISQLLDLVPLPEEKTRILPSSPVNN